MAAALEELEAEILRLSPADRSKLLDRLVVSLDLDARLESAWDAEADRREAELAASTGTASLEEVIARLEERFPG
jgi:CMP-N-acetylneuraminic acid synthetase